MVMNSLKTDLLVVGTGLSGTLFALELAKKRSDLQILLLNKKGKEQNASYFAQGGIAAAMGGATDSIEKHLEDTLEASAHSSNPDVAAHFISQAPDAIRTLEQWGALFDKKQDGSRALALEGGHSAKRVLHHQDSTGKHILEKLHAALLLYPNIRLMEDVQVLELKQAFFTATVRGACAWDYKSAQALDIQAKAVVLATGGLGSLYAYSTNPSTAKGEGVYLAAKAGAFIKDLAFVQFHPTALWQPSGTQLPLISEAVRGAGAFLRNEQGERFMQGQHSRLELAPRDVVARCISNEIRKQQKPYVYLDGTLIDLQEWEQHFPGILSTCKAAGIDPCREWIPVVPAAHYLCGGVATSVYGETSINYLYAIGETACTGLHGANRLASNSLLEATLMATSLADSISRVELPSLCDLALDGWKIVDDKKAEKTADHYLAQIRQLVQQGCGIQKTNQSLLETYNSLIELKAMIGLNLPEHSLQYQRTKMALQTALMLSRSSLKQKENIGVFFNHDLEIEAVELG